MKTKLNKEQLNTLDKDILINLVLNMQEQIAIMNGNTFGRKTEKITVIEDQTDCFSEIFNEAEAAYSGQTSAEPGIEEIVVAEHKREKRKGKREEDLSDFPVVKVEHTIPKEELDELFPSGYTMLPDEVYKKLEVIPARFEVYEHHISVYKGKDGRIVKAPHPKEVLNNSIATPSVIAGIINSKYTNAVPLYRQEQEYARNGVNLSRQLMAGWVIKVAERYISLVYERIREEVCKSGVIHADETPVMVTKDGREGMHKNYMWVYRTGKMCKAKQAVIYEYQKTRKADAPRDFLKGFSGKLVCDGYQVYHALENEEGVKFQVSGCWVHARRPFAQVEKAVGKDNAVGTVAHEAMVQIQNIIHTDNSLYKLPPSKRKEQRKRLVKPLVDNYFRWAKESLNRVPPGSATSKGIKYSLNQEKYLRTFLSDPALPLDNNIAEQAIRPFCVGKKNWKLIDTVNGANASAILYSIVETAKANELNIYQYFKHLLTEIPKHMDETNLSFLDELLPWSEKLPDVCRKKNTK